MSRKSSLVFLVQLVIIWALFFLGWGLDDLRGFFAHPARTGLFLVGLLFIGVALLCRLEVDPFRKGEKSVGRQRWAVPLLMLVAFALLWYLPFGDRRNLWVFAASDGLRYAGLGLHVVGLAVRLAALATLGKQFSGYVTLQENHQLVQTGIYGLVRHPMYLGGFLAWSGLGLIFRSWVTIPFLVLSIVFVAARIRAEEKLLAGHFGTEFDAYRRRTWRLIPYLY